MARRKPFSVQDAAISYRTRAAFGSRRSAIVIWRQYGLVEYRVLEMLESRLVTESLYPHGGHQWSLNIVAGWGWAARILPWNLPAFLVASRNSIPVEDSYVRMPQIPGIALKQSDYSAS